MADIPLDLADGVGRPNFDRQRMAVVTLSSLWTLCQRSGVQRNGIEPGEKFADGGVPTPLPGSG